MSEHKETDFISHQETNPVTEPDAAPTISPNEIVPGQPEYPKLVEAIKREISDELLVAERSIAELSKIDPMDTEWSRWADSLKESVDHIEQEREKLLAGLFY